MTLAFILLSSVGPGLPPAVMSCQYLSSKWHMTYRCSYAVLVAASQDAQGCIIPKTVELAKQCKVPTYSNIQHHARFATQYSLPCDYVPGCCRSAIPSSLLLLESAGFPFLIVLPNNGAGPLLTHSLPPSSSLPSSPLPRRMMLCCVVE